ncbi:MAG: acetylxylan esterase [Bacteroidetes bacterium]|nr:acetylxylan esterase [Bacteroidota bacterium]
MKFRHKVNFFTIIICLLVIITGLHAQEIAITEEDKVPFYTLPEILISGEGKKIDNTYEWLQIRRPEILDMFRHQVYGKVPENEIKVSFVPSETKYMALSGKAVRKEISIIVSNGIDSVNISLLIYLPDKKSQPVPLFIGLNFYGNHTINSDPGITITQSWMRNKKEFYITENKATDMSRGVRQSCWPVEKILDRGYGLATIYYGDIDPDYDDGFKNGIHPLFYKGNRQNPAPDEWGSISTWAWGLSKAMDYFEIDPDIDQNKVIVFGHSRLGKTALWAGARDSRFAIVISNNSGCGGAALSRRAFGETVKRINTVFPHWFCKNFHQYNNNEEKLPVDQHMLISLIAPRPVYIASASEDLWADPKGEFLSAMLAEKVYKLFGKEGLGVTEMPEENQPVNQGYIGYHIRHGKHDITWYDWQNYLDFADHHFSQKD